MRVEARRETDAEQREAAAAGRSPRPSRTAWASGRREVVDPETLERSVGKIKRVKDLRNSLN